MVQSIMHLLLKHEGLTLTSTHIKNTGCDVMACARNLVLGWEEVRTDGSLELTGQSV